MINLFVIYVCLMLLNLHLYINAYMNKTEITRTQAEFCYVIFVFLYFET